MAENPMKAIEQIDPTLVSTLGGTRSSALSEGAIPLKYKYLMAMVLDATQGAVGGTTGFARSALQAGATPGEIGEALRIGNYIYGAPCVYVAARAFQGLFD